MLPQGFKATWPSTGCQQDHQQPDDFFCWVSSPKLEHAGLLLYGNSEQCSSDTPSRYGLCAKLFRSGTPNITPGKKKGKGKGKQERMLTLAKAEQSATSVSNSFFIHLSVNTCKITNKGILASRCFKRKDIHPLVHIFCFLSPVFLCMAQFALR